MRHQYESVSLSDSLHNSLHIREGAFRVLFLGDTPLLAYSREHTTSQLPQLQTHIPIDFEGSLEHLYLNPGFFKNLFPSRLESKSEMQNLAKSFFLLNARNHVALVQYLPRNGSSNEHYHTLPESIIQLRGRSYVELRPVEDDTKVRTVELTEGSKLMIPPRSLHSVVTEDDESITVPVKQTIPGTKDHLYQARSQGRTNLELDRITSAHYSSGDELVIALNSYYSGLKDEERRRLIEAMELTIQSTSNPNLREFLKGFLEDN